MARMTLEEYNLQQDQLLEELPEELRPVISWMAYERGHSGGYEEVIGILTGLVSDLKGPIVEYGHRRERQGRQGSQA